jgi:ATP/maltotriose-dependent transcriptional regulator MalT
MKSGRIHLQFRLYEALKMVDYRKNVSPLNNDFKQKSHEIVGEFYSQDRHYWIVSIENSSTDRSSKITPYSRSFNQLETELKESEQFEVNGQNYALIEDGQNPHNFAEDIPRLLSGRELQIATLVALGQANKQIASQLHISEWTVSTHLRRIFAKLGVDSRAAMVYRCTSLLHQVNPLLERMAQSKRP